MTSLPVSVLVPHQKKRRHFFLNYSLPSFYAAGALEVLVDDSDRHPNVKRNALARKAKGKYLFFADDDVILAAGALEQMLTRLRKANASNQRVVFCYADSHAFTYPGAGTVWQGSRRLTQPSWDEDEVRRSGTITPMSLILRSAFPGFDESLGKGHMWDLCLTLMAQKLRGVKAPVEAFLQFDVDDGLTNNARLNVQREIKKIRKKHAC